ncbi:hypothetical protein G7072_09785 [Nocardioides sp. HDW12B]|uniref:primosomal protein N' n=1 Tax=Nocardioides sp. HDW12B TaxID=2714939 RepID=UPI00140B61DD|nr:primosomal protein N' [Nocardioides sp. HDW12B]QIK66595.1 hypothetical protein G7072_09785 [Nocardioides sp. HDW12B]
MTPPDDADDGQGALLPALAGARRKAASATAEVRRREARAPVEPATHLPVARVLVDVPLAHLDRPFDYLVPETMSDRVVSGSRVKVRFAGQDVDGFVLERVAESDHPGRLAPLRRAVSAEPVLTPEVARLTGLVAARYAGTRSDVLRLAVPPRHATVEKEARRPRAGSVPDGARAEDTPAGGPRSGGSSTGDAETDGASPSAPTAGASTGAPTAGASTGASPGAPTAGASTGAPTAGASTGASPDAPTAGSSTGASAGASQGGGTTEVQPDGPAAWWRRYPGGESLAAAWAGPAVPSTAGRRPEAPAEMARAVWTVAPGDDWATGLAHAAAATLSAGKGSVLCVPDTRDLARLDAALTAVLGPDRHVTLSADLGPAPRYRAFLAVARGDVRVVAGTRAAAFAPVHDLGLVGQWDDGDDLYAEPRAPYPHTREVLLLRAHDTGAAVLLAARARSVEAGALVTSGWAREVVADRAEVRRRAPRVSVTGDRDVEIERDPHARAARIPSTAHAAIRDGLQVGPVLVQTPRLGYAAALTCRTCRTPARCRRCQGPLVLPRAGEAPTCRWCGQADPGHACRVCGDQAVRVPVVGDRRTAEELGRAFPRVPVRRSSGDHVLDRVGPEPALVIATPGAEPEAEDGYAAVVLLDTWLLLARVDLRAGEEAARRWFNAAALARPAERGGRVVAVGEPSEPALQALVRWDPASLAVREAEDRSAAHLPPASRLAVLTGDPQAVEDVLTVLELPDGAEVLGPVAVDPGGAVPPAGRDPEARVVVRVPRASGAALSRSLLEVQGVRAARKLPTVRVQVDPWALG